METYTLYAKQCITLLRHDVRMHVLQLITKFVIYVG